MSEEGVSLPASNGEGSNTRFEGFSDYQAVSGSIARAVDDALEAYTEIQSLHVEHARVNAEQAALARSKILAAALRLVPELREDAPEDEQYQQILARWLGSVTIGEETITPSEDIEVSEGYIEALNGIRLRDECPLWLYQFVIDIRTAGWELGYLQAGRKVKTDDGLDPAEKEAKDMFKQ